MQPFTTLARLALIGTEHQAPEAPVLGDATLDHALANLGPVTERESILLKTGATLTLARRAGFKPTDKMMSFSPAEAEVQPRCPGAAGHDLARMLHDYQPQVLPEWLDLAGRQGARVPEELLPELLVHGKTKAPLQAAIKTVLGKRGAWLAAQNPDWAYAISADEPEKSWQEGRREERLTALRKLRQTEPARALELLAGTWKDEAPEDRAEFIQALQIGLSLQDEDFLEAALDDKRKEVRTRAVQLLASLPDSKLVKYLTQAATPLLRAKKRLLRNPVLELDLPSECTKEMKRYGVGASSPPSKDIGEKAWWVTEILQAIPPGYWSQTLGLSPKNLIEMATESEWSKVLLTGWSTALSRRPDPEWIEAWLEAALGHEALISFYLLPSAVNGFPGAELEPLLIKLQRKDKAIFAGQRIVAFRVMASGPWSEAFSTQLLQDAQANLGQYTSDYSARAAWQNFLRVLAQNTPPHLPLATTGWPKEIDPPSVREIVDEFCAVIEFRRAMHRHFKGEN